jgi:peroxiredoxin
MANLQPGDQNILFSLPGVDEQFYSLSSYADKNAVVVVFTCNHCPWAQAWEGRLIQIQAEYGPKGVQILAINANDAVTHPGDSFEAMQQRAQEKGFNFPYLHDEEQAVAHAYGAERTPEVFVFDKAGILQYHGAVDDNADDPAAVQHAYLRDALDAVLAGQTPATAQTPPKGCTIKWKQPA